MLAYRERGRPAESKTEKSGERRIRESMGCFDFSRRKSVEWLKVT